MVPLKVSTEKVRKLKADAWLREARNLPTGLAGDCMSPVAVSMSPWDTVAMTVGGSPVKKWNSELRPHQTYVRCRFLRRLYAIQAV